MHSGDMQGDKGMNSGGNGGMQSSAECVYVVKPGDMLGQIAQHYGVSVHEIIRANGVGNPDIIYVGQKFQIPGCRSDGPAQPDMHPQGEPNDTKSGPDMGMGGMGNGGNGRPDSAMTDQSGPQPDRPSQSYRVRRGDSLSQIAADFGVNSYDLAQVNGIQDMNLLYVGQVLQIP